MNTLIALAIVAVAVTAAGVVFTREPLRQAAAAGAFGLALAVLFVLLRAPDVAISELLVGSVFVPGMVLFGLAKVYRRDG